MSRGLGYSILFALGLTSPLQAQVVRGTLSEVGSRVPLEGAVVALVPDDDESPQAVTLTDASGAFALPAAAGSWRVRAELIGHGTVYSASLEIAGRDDVVVDLAAPVEAVSLEEVNVTAADRRCLVRPGDEGLLTAVAWEQARKALESSYLSQQSELTRFGGTLYERELDHRTLAVEDEAAEPYGTTGARPFSGASPESLATRGFVQATDSGTFYFAPDERVLLSDVFLDGHCFHVQASDDRPDLLGLAFEPVRGARQTDIQGVLWLDRKTGGLRSLDYRYVNLDVGVPTEKLGGGMRFQRLPTGVWIPRRWWIRMPIIEVRQRTIVGRVREERVLSGLLERGGEVLSVEAGGVRLERLDRPRVQGTVYDSTRARPLEGARVHLVGTEHETRTGPHGRFALSAPEGEFELAFDHPRLDTLGIRARSAPVTLRPEVIPEVRLAIPPWESVAVQSCGEAGEPVVSGVVRDSTARPLRDARVQIVWRGTDRSYRSRSVRSDATGRFVFCGAPADAELLAHATHNGLISEALTFRTATRGVVTTELILGRLHTARLTGRVTDAGTGQPLPQTVVRVPLAGLETLSDANGAFAFADVPPGRQLLELEHPFYGLQSEELDIEAGSTLSLSAVLEGEAVRLDPLTITVEARRAPGEAGFYARRDRGIGFFMVEEQIRQAQAVRMTDLFNAVPGLTVACGQPDVLGSGCRVGFERARALGPGGRERPCPVQYFLDGSSVGKETIDALRPANVLGMEVYNGLSEVPPEFRRGPDTRCGTIAVWLKSRL